MNSERAASSVNEISRTTTEISKGVVDISRNIQEINGASNEVAMGAETTNLSAKNLSDIAIELESLIKQFKI